MYNFDKDFCDECGVKKENNNFFLGYDGTVLCPKCRKEKLLNDLFRDDLMHQMEQPVYDRRLD